MEYKDLHKWDLPARAAAALQSELAGRIRLGRIPLENVRIAAGVDVSVKDDMSRAAITVLSFPALEVLETVTFEAPVVFPYVPGLLSFREAPVILGCVKRLRTVPDVFIFDGQGTAHPRRMGIASHLGLFLAKPTVGCAKSRLYGAYEEPGPEKGALSPLLAPGGEALGAALRTRAGVKPVLVSPGHLADIPSSVELILRCSPKYKIPEPIRAAHKAAALGKI